MSSKTHRHELVKLARSFRVARSFTNDVVFSFLSDLDCPRSLAVWMLYDSKEHAQLADLEIEPSWYNTMADFRDAYAATHFLAKSDFLTLDVKKDEAAFDKFFKFEDLCRQTNRRFRDLSLDPLFKGANVWLLNAVTRKIAQVLGDFSPEEWVDSANWGPGVTNQINGCHVSAVNKFSHEAGITRQLHDLVEPWFHQAYPTWFRERTSAVRKYFDESGSSYVVGHPTQLITAYVEQSDLGYVEEVGNSIITVPKNSKIDRVIAVEPGLNLWFQKGVGAMIRRRLLREGIDLNDQTRNAELARLGSLYGTLATVDFSSASDSIAYNLVRELLPPVWFSVMDSCRSPIGIRGEQQTKWEKFSSMGNGFTFELESLIFYAAACAVREYTREDGVVSVFGDDVILPSSCCDLFYSFATFLGFKVNTQKSFSEGPFRESCGAHYWSGICVKPIYLKEMLSNVQSVYKLANGVRALAHRRGFNCGCDHRLRHTWRRLFLGVPKSLRLRVPPGVGDCGFHSNWDEAAPTAAAARQFPMYRGFEGFVVDGLIESGVKSLPVEHSGVLLARLRLRSHDQALGNNYTLRGRTRVDLKRLLVSQWSNYGSWQ